MVKFMGDIGRINEQVIRVRTHFGSSNVDAWCVLASHCAKHPPTDLFNATSNMFETKMLREEVTQSSRPKSNIAKTESMKTTGMRTMGTSGGKKHQRWNKTPKSIPNPSNIHGSVEYFWKFSRPFHSCSVEYSKALRRSVHSGSVPPRTQMWQ